MALTVEIFAVTQIFAMSSQMAVVDAPAQACAQPSRPGVGHIRVLDLVHQLFSLLGQPFACKPLHADLGGTGLFGHGRDGHLQGFCAIDDRRMRHEDFEPRSAEQLERATPGLAMADFQ